MEENRVNEKFAFVVYIIMKFVVYWSGFST